MARKLLNKLKFSDVKMECENIDLVLIDEIRPYKTKKFLKTEKNLRKKDVVFSLNNGYNKIRNTKVS